MTARLAQCSTWVRIPKPTLKKDAESFFKDALKADPKSILVVKSKATWSGYLLNGRCYPGVHMEQGIPTWCSKDRGGVAPYDMPVLLNHDAKVDAIGRVIAASYHRIATGDAWFGDWKMPAREFNKGSGYTELTMAISDEAAQQKFLDGRYVTFSTAFRSPFAGCSICHTNLMQETCDHTIGDTYETPDGSERECYIITGAQFNKECSVVNHPAQPWAVAEEMKWAGELKDALSDQSINSDELLNRYEIRSGLVEIAESPMLAVIDSAGKGTLLTVRAEDEAASAEYTHLKKTMITAPNFEQMAMEDETNLMPTGGMKSEAKKYRKWKEEGHPGGTGVAAARATQILSGKPLSPSTVITMNAWFARHEVDKKGKGFSPGEEGFPSPGRVAWAAWGGDAGQSWAAEKAKVIKNQNGDATTDDSFVDDEVAFLDIDTSITLTNKEPAMDSKETKPSAATAPAVSQTGTPVVAEDTVKVLTASLQKEQDRNKELQSQFDSATAEKNALATKLTDSEKKLHRSMCEHLALLRALNGVKPSGYKLEDAQGLQAYVDGELVKRTSDSISDSIRDEMVVLDGKLPSLKGLGSFIQDRTQARDSGAVTAKVEDTEEVAELKIKTKKTVGKDLV